MDKLPTELPNKKRIIAIIVAVAILSILHISTLTYGIAEAVGTVCLFYQLT
jgi:hypothetical protein